ncbi:3-hydroxyacyl-CoA dehydrogenase family protein [Oceanobacillus sp. CAU 1775]
MDIKDINKITVIGSGLMGSQIGMVCALAGYRVTINDIDQGKLDEAKNMLEKRMHRRVEKGKFTREEFESVFSKITFNTDLESSVNDTDYVIEAIVEKVEVKQELFSQIDKLAPEHTIIASNSSTIVSSKMAEHTNRPEKVCNFHFFNPALVMELVEVVKGEHTSEETVNVSLELAKRLNKTPILIKKEILGFVTNRILTAIFDEALYLYENGYASLEEIDIACKKGLNHPIGPFELLDLTGIDLNYHIKEYIYSETQDEKDKPSQSLTEKYRKKEWGKKSGIGFYNYK